MCFCHLFSDYSKTDDSQIQTVDTQEINISSCSILYKIELKTNLGIKSVEMGNLFYLLTVCICDLKVQEALRLTKLILLSGAGFCCCRCLPGGRFPRKKISEALGLSLILFFVLHNAGKFLKVDLPKKRLF